MPAFRFYHSLLALGSLTAYFTAEELGLIHAWLGYGLAALLGLRLLLALAHMRGFALRRMFPRWTEMPPGRGGIRHPAIGQALALALFCCVAGAAGTGIVMDGGGTLTGRSIRADDQGKVDALLQKERDQSSREFTFGLIAVAYGEDAAQDREGNGEQDGPLGAVHEVFGNLLLIIVAAHAAWLLLFRFELARYMLFMAKKRANARY